MKVFTEPLLPIEQYDSVLKALKAGESPVEIAGPSESAKAHLIYSISQHIKKKCIIVTYNDIQARKLFEDISFFAGDQALLLPSRELILFNVAAKNNDIEFSRVNTLHKILRSEYTFLVTSIDSLLGKTVSPEDFKKHIIDITDGRQIDLEELEKKLVLMGYESTVMVEGKGQFSKRGGIIDIFPVNSEFAMRVELFDDIVDSIRLFDILTQRSVEKVQSFTVLPANEFFIEEERKENIIKKIEHELEKALQDMKDKGYKETAEKLSASVREDIEKIRNNNSFAGIEKYISLILEEYSSVIDYTENETILFFDEPAKCKNRVETMTLEIDETIKDLVEKGQFLPSCHDVILDFDEIISEIKRRKIVLLDALSNTNSGIIPKAVYNIASRSINSYQGRLDVLVKEVDNWKDSGYKVVILAGTKAKAEKLSETLLKEKIENACFDIIPEKMLPGQVIITHGSINKGFEYPSIKFAVISDKEVFGSDRKHTRTRSKDSKHRIKVFTELNIGDYVVHDIHGIGQYVGIDKLVVEGITKDYVKIRYLNNDFLYIPTVQMDLIQKYVGSGGNAPRLSKLGGSEWTKTKKRVKESLKEFAEELIKLYAEREATKGYAFSKDAVWQTQFEDAFPYEETPDQIKCIEEIKKDMESDKVMDRLLCGDVGYGKTEVAVRAAFKAIMDGKQVAYLVPTTVLAQQHYNNFIKRMQDYPVKIDMLSRFRTAAEQKKILSALKSGRIDILVGTHRLIQKDIEFKDLGLLIIDEEHRFGVAQKEILKSIRKNVDVLTLTATPIPRTLHMSLAGIRDISTIEDPPAERYPVQTFVMEYDEHVIRDAILREIGRKGQVFYLNNRVKSIYRKAKEIEKMVPDARIAVAHGQMDEKELEDVMYSFIQGDYDILVCTTIIESGLDIPNVNTIVIEDADKMGLAQLYQLRGRVGRADRLSYAYITYVKDKVLSEEASKRLQAIKEFTEFGSGFRIAMRDLEIRGAGNILGPEQHGHMEAVGYEMYCKLLDQAVGELKGQDVSAGAEEFTIDIEADAYIDEQYIPDEHQRIEIYRKIASVKEEEDIEDIQDELIDRYGDIPGAVQNLIDIAQIKMLAVRIGIISIINKNRNVVFQFRASGTIDLRVISSLMEKYKRKILFTASAEPYLTYRVTEEKPEQLIRNIKFILQDIKNFAD